MVPNEAHGENRVEMRDAIIRVELAGAFNEFGVRAFTDKIKGYIELLENAPFAILINDLQLEGGTPEAYQELERYNHWLNTQNLVAKAMVIDSSLQLQMIDRLSPSRSKQNIRAFTDEEDALHWLREQLVNLKP